MPSYSELNSLRLDGSLVHHHLEYNPMREKIISFFWFWSFLVRHSTKLTYRFETFSKVGTLAFFKFKGADSNRSGSSLKKKRTHASLVALFEAIERDFFRPAFETLDPLATSTAAGLSITNMLIRAKIELIERDSLTNAWLSQLSQHQLETPRKIHNILSYYKLTAFFFRLPAQIGNTVLCLISDESLEGSPVFSGSNLSLEAGLTSYDSMYNAFSEALMQALASRFTENRSVHPLSCYAWLFNGVHVNTPKDKILPYTIPIKTRFHNHHGVPLCSIQTEELSGVVPKQHLHVSKCAFHRLYRDIDLCTEGVIPVLGSIEPDKIVIN